MSATRITPEDFSRTARAVRETAESLSGENDVSDLSKGTIQQRLAAYQLLQRIGVSTADDELLAIAYRITAKATASTRVDEVQRAMVDAPSGGERREFALRELRAAVERANRARRVR